MKDGPNILKAVDWAYAYGNAGDVFVLSAAAYDYLEVVGRWDEVITYTQRALDLALSVQNHVAIARLSNIVGWVLRQRGEYEEAADLFQRALEHTRSAQSREGECITLQHLSGVYRKLGQFERAKRCCNEAWMIAQELAIGDLRALINMEHGKLARDMGHWQLAWDRLAQVRDWFQERAEETPRDEILARSVWGQLAIVAYHLGHPKEAKELCLKSLEFFQDSSTKGFWATLNYRLALAEETLGEYEDARKHAKASVDWFERLGMKPDLAEAEILLARLRGE
jgi:tetratricopeptide (TPR) repeat protein